MKAFFEPSSIPAAEDNVRKFNTIRHTITMLALVASCSVFAMQIDPAKAQLNKAPSSLNANKAIKNNERLFCKATINDNLNSSRNTNQFTPASLNFLNDSVKATYTTMRNGIFSHVKMKIISSLLNFNVNGFAPENIASYVSEGAKPFLPFKFANGVKITNVRPQDRAIVYRVELPISKNHNHATPLIVAGKISASTIICNDRSLVENLLKRDVVIQYDYYDSNGIFFYSLTINV